MVCIAARLVLRNHCMRALRVQKGQAQPTTPRLWWASCSRLQTSQIPPSTTHWHYGFRGGDWNASIDPSWVCLSGKAQSPINLPLPSNDSAHVRPGIDSLRTTWSYSPLTSNGSDVQARLPLVVAVTVAEY
jgi:carbonic anhydrase